jgi:hypothetical protein
MQNQNIEAVNHGRTHQIFSFIWLLPITQITKAVDYKFLASPVNWIEEIGRYWCSGILGFGEVGVFGRFGMR